MAGGVTQAVECWLWKHEALSSNPNPITPQPKQKPKTIALNIFVPIHNFLLLLDNL
jgi:hypothetical protein